MNLNEWAIRWNIPYEAVDDLRRAFGMIPEVAPGPQPAGSEAAAQNEVRLEASAAGCRIWRNNVGATETADGTFIRYGLANDSQQMNRVIKSSDLIGISPVVVTPDMVGNIVGVFMAREIKAPGWVYTGTAREEAQLKFLQLVAGLGGDACFATGRGTI